MILTKVENPPPTREELVDRRLAALEARLAGMEEAQGASWSFSAVERGGDLERRVGLLHEAVADLLGAIQDSRDATAALRADLARLGERLGTEEEEGQSRADSIFAALDAIASAIGLPTLGAHPSGLVDEWLDDLRETAARRSPTA